MDATTIDLFAGAGGLAEGFRQAGFSVLAANDFDEDAAATFKHNFPEADVIAGPVEAIQATDLLRKHSLKRGQLDVLVGGPPCQAFSVYNHSRGMHDARSGLFREYLRLVDGLLPRVVVMENVPGITSVGNGLAVAEIYKTLSELGYQVEHRLLKAEEFGVPQERRRIFFVGVRKASRFQWPVPTHRGEDPDGGMFINDLLPLTTTRDAIGDLPVLQICEGSDESVYTRKPKTDYQRLMRAGATTLFNHVAPFLADVNLERLKHIPQGGSWRDIPYELLPAGMKKAKRSDHTKRYGRLAWNGLACTILTKCDLHWGAYVHPEQERAITPREAARFQSFPDRFRFLGTMGSQFRQVGNAVPCLLARAVAVAVMRSLDNQKPIARAKKKGLGAKLGQVPEIAAVAPR